MRPSRNISLLAATTILASSATVWAEMITEQEALTIAENYISLTLCQDGDWGGAEGAEVAEIQEFQRDQRTLGYFCRVEPQGFLVVSLHRELAPVKAYSVWSDLDPEAEEGLTDLLKDCMERVLEAVEDRLGHELRPDDKFSHVLEISYLAATAVLAAEEFDPEDYRDSPRGSGPGMDYQEGDVLLTTQWHQKPPYNEWCPDHDCSWPNYGYFNENAKVGCVATAGAQIMRYWYWPPHGAGGSPYDDPYDWPNMCREYIWDWDVLWFLDENGAQVSWAQIDAVAELCREIGMAAEMDYGCDISETPTHHMVGVYESHYRYSTICDREDRSDHDPLGWFDMIKDQLNVNRPVQYRYPNHSIVGDGWKEEWIGDDYYWYHMNYGWNDAGYYDTWYALDELYGGDPDDEYMIRNIMPALAIVGTVNGTYQRPSFPYRYFSTDTTGVLATFEAGQYLQILNPGFLLRSIGSAAESITFYGEPSAHTVFFFHGDPDNQTRIRISGGALRLCGGGSMVVY